MTCLNYVEGVKGRNETFERLEANNLETREVIPFQTKPPPRPVSPRPAPPRAHLRMFLPPLPIGEGSAYDSPGGYVRLQVAVLSRGYKDEGARDLWPTPQDGAPTTRVSGARITLHAETYTVRLLSRFVNNVEIFYFQKISITSNI